MEHHVLEIDSLRALIRQYEHENILLRLEVKRLREHAETQGWLVKEKLKEESHGSQNGNSIQAAVSCL